MDKVISLAERKEDGTLWSPIDALQDAITKYEDPEYSGNKVLILHLNDEDGSYNVGFTQAGMSASEMIGVLELAKTVMKEHMGYG